VTDHDYPDGEVFYKTFQVVVVAKALTPTPITKIMRKKPTEEPPITTEIPNVIVFEDEARGGNNKLCCQILVKCRGW
jgi:hypothetical protein